MVKICHITSVHSWNDTRIFYKECVTLAQNGYQVSLVAPNAENRIEENVRVLGVSNNSKSRIYRATMVASKVLLKAIKTKSKIYHFHDPELIWVGIVLRLMGKKVVFDVHENVKAQITDKKWLRFPKLTIKLYSFFEWLAAKMFYIVIAEDSYEELFEGRAKPITKILNFPIVLSLSQYRKPISEKTENGILYVGLVSEARGIIEIIQALAILKSKNIPFVFHCIGPISDEVRLIIESTPDYSTVKDTIVFYGRLPIYEAYRYAKKSKVALSILHPVPNYIRSYSTKIFEYMAIGIPFIVSDFKIYEFVKEKGIGFLVNPLHPSEIADKIEGVLINQIDLEKVISASFEEVSTNYSWESQAKKLIELYNVISKK